jgi:hypothetical protein
MQCVVYRYLLLRKSLFSAKQIQAERQNDNKYGREEEKYVRRWTDGRTDRQVIR